MTVHWGSLLAVFLVSLGSAVAVVALVATALWGLSARVVAADARRCHDSPAGWGRPSPRPA